MKIELKRDDDSLKDITVELEPGFYHDQSQWSPNTTISVQELVEFYETWKEVVFGIKTMGSMKQVVNALYGDLVKLEEMIEDRLKCKK